MKNYFIRVLAIVLLLVGFIIVTPALAQELSYDKAYADYIYNVDLYEKAHSDYEIAKAQYESSKTISSETKARQSTAAMLIARDEVVITYLAAIRAKLKGQVGVSESDKTTLYTLIDTENAWYQNHKKGINSAGTLNDLVSDSNEAATRFMSTELIAYDTLLTVSIGKTADFRTREQKIIADLKQKVSEIKVAGDKNVDPVERALTEAEEKLARSVEKEQAANALMAKVKTTEKDKLKFSNSAELLVGESLSYIKEANSIVKDAIRQIKTAD